MSARVTILVLAACGGDQLAARTQAASSCGFGTHEEQGICVLDTTRFELRIPPQIGAVPKRNRVTVFGTAADGTPATGELVFSVEPPGAGTFVADRVTLGRLGAETFYVPCDPETILDCATSATLSVAFASDPATPIATAGIQMVDPITVSPAKECLTGGNVIHLEGGGVGSLTIQNPTFTFPPTKVGPSIWRATATPTNANQAAWFLDFNITRLTGALIPGKTYEDAFRAEFDLSEQVLSHPAMYVRQADEDCTTVRGKFEVVDYEVDFSMGDPGSKRATFVFEQHCNGDLQTALTGCVHYEQ
jgi:hypothetical protein